MDRIPSRYCALETQMKLAILFCMGVSMATTAWGAECASSTVTVRNGQNVTSVTQSGDCTTEEIHVEPGKTFIHRESGGNSSTTMQQSTIDQATLERLQREFGKWALGRP